MDKANIKTAIMSAMSEEIDLWLEKAGSIKSGYDYESEFMQTARKVNNLLLTCSLGEVSGNRNKKNSIPVLEPLKSTNPMF